MAEPQWEVYMELSSSSVFVPIDFDHTKYEYRISAFDTRLDITTNEFQVVGFPNLTIRGRDGFYALTEEAYPNGSYSASLRYSASTTRPKALIERLSIWSPPAMYPKVDGAVKETEMAWVKIDGTLREVDKVWIKVNGVLREA